MVGAFAASGLFLVSYVTYHYVHGDTKFTGEGALRAVYFGILVSHILLSALVVPGALFAFWFAGTKRFSLHKRVTRVLLPVWLYVSVTGVVIFFMLKAWGQAAA
jgi:putative membrane protein